MAAPKEKDSEPSWVVLPSVRDALGFPQYVAPSDRVRRDPETLVLDVPALPRKAGWRDLSFKGVLYGTGVGLISAVGIGEGAVVLICGGLGLILDICITGWHLARGMVRRSHAWKRHLGTTTLQLSDESISCHSYDGSIHRVAWSEIDRVTVCLRDGSVHLCWRLVGSGEEACAEVGPGVDFYQVYNALMRRAEPLEYVLAPELQISPRRAIDPGEALDGMVNAWD